MRSSSKRNLSGIEKVFILFTCWQCSQLQQFNSMVSNYVNSKQTSLLLQLKLEFSCIEFSKIRKGSFLANSPVKIIYNISTVSQVTTRLELDITIHSKLTAHEMNLALRWPALDFQTHVICPSFLPRACTPVKLTSKKKDISTKYLHEIVAFFDNKVRFHIIRLFLMKT